MNTSLTIGTRGSQLALWQAQFVKKQLAHHFPDIQVSLKIIKTTGDTIQNRSLLELGKGAFTKEIEIALLNGDIDLAVHSLKDLPTTLPQGLCIAAIPKRDDVRDVLITRTGLLLEQLPRGAKIGTTSPRRKAQILSMCRHVQVVDVRGNIDTRLRKLRETDLAGIVLAAAGVKRLFEPEIITQIFDADRIVPAAGQGALAIEAREGDSTVHSLLAPLNDSKTTAAVTAERTVLEILGGGCHLPLGVYARHVRGELSIIATAYHPQGAYRVIVEATGTPDAPEHLGRILAGKLQTGSSGRLLKRVEAGSIGVTNPSLNLKT